MKLITIFNLIAFSFLINASNAKKSYEGYKVYKVIPKTVGEIDLIKQLKTVEFWEEHFEVNYGSKLMVAPDNQKKFLEITRANNVSVQEVIANLESVINEQSRPTRHLRSTNQFLSFDWDNYHNLDEISKWLDELEQNYPDVIKTVIIGKTVENRDIKGVVLNYNPEKENKLIGVIEGGIHAREWISPATVTWILKEFLTSTDPKVRQLAESLEWHFLPTVNPDGYSYTFTNDRMWRKNRSKTNSTSCVSSGVEDDRSNGVDLNRNFNFVWNMYGTSNDPCSNTFAGPAPDSEPETKAIENYVLDLKTKGELIYYLAFHSYSQLLIVPYSHLSGSEVLQANNFGDMFEIAMRSADKLSERYGTMYKVGVSADVMYEMSGTSFDWVKHATDVPVSYLFELRDLGDHGFLLPPEQIVPNNLEIMDALLELDRTTRALGYYQSSANSAISLLSLVLLLLVVVIFC